MIRVVPAGTGSREKHATLSTTTAFTPYLAANPITASTMGAGATPRTIDATARRSTGRSRQSGGSGGGYQ